MDFANWLDAINGAAGWQVALVAIALAGLISWALRSHSQQGPTRGVPAFLLAAVVLAMAYGIVNDQLTATISWEYFYYGKGLNQSLGPQTPPDMLALRWQAVRVGIVATWAVGLFFGAVVLLANTTMKHKPSLPSRQLYRWLPLPLLTASLGGLLLGLAGYHGWLAEWSDEFRLLAQHDVFRPRLYMAVYGIHLGGYIGSALGGALAVWRVLRTRDLAARAA